MNLVVVCGASGMVGRALIDTLTQRGTPFAVVGRDPARLADQFPIAQRCMSWEGFRDGDSSDVGTIVNLAGAGVNDERWSPAYKKTMTESRLASTAVCASVCAENPTIHLINASSVHAYGIYAGDHGAFTESDRDRRMGTCYLQELIDDWEAATLPATDAGSAVSLLRIGVVLSMDGGALPPLATPFTFFVGGRYGTGKQVMSWISLRDVVAAIVFLIDRPDIEGPVNVVAPNAVTNAEFARALGKALKRPSAVPLPAAAVRLILGEAGDELVLAGQRVSPVKLLDAGFEFADRDISNCLEHLVARKAA